MQYKIVSILFCLLGVVSCDELYRKPVYKYRYETEDVMKTAASSIPVHGYHFVEGGYYPTKIASAGFEGGAGGIGGYGGSVGGFGGGYSGGKYTSIGGIGGIGGYEGSIGGVGAGIGPIGGIGLSKVGPVGFGGGAGFSKLGGAGLGSGIGLGAGVGPIIGGGKFIGGGIHHPYGGEEIDKKIYSGEKKNVNDEVYEKESGKKGEEINHGKAGYSEGQVAIKEGKGDSGYYSDIEGGKKVIGDGKQYHGEQKFSQEGKNGGEKKEQSNHKKGHKIKGFKHSHHKDESGKTEEFYDESHDEGDHFNFDGKSGSFGESAGESFKGGHDDEKFKEGEHKKAGHYENGHFVDKSNADHGKYGENKYAGNGVVYGKNNGFDQESLLGHQENSRFYKHHPYHVPFYH